MKETIGRYQVIHQLGRGGMATVYLAKDPSVNRQVAIKVLASVLTQDYEFRTRFEREAEMIARLEHPAIIPVYDYGIHRDQPYIVMRYMGGGNLSERIEAEGDLPLSEAARIIKRVCEALTAAHKIGIIHRDVKPANILFDEKDEVYLSDFGIIKIIGDDARLTAGGVVGTAAYVSPEQVYGDQKISARSDIYALGVMLFEMLTGERPYQDANPSKLMMKHILDPLPDIHKLRPDLPKEVGEIITRSMAKTPIQRYETAKAFSEAVTAASQITPSRWARRAIIDDDLAAALDALLDESEQKPPPETEEKNEEQ